MSQSEAGSAQNGCSSARDERPALSLVWLAVVGAFLLALAVRALGFEWVFVGDGVVFPPADAQYHVRRSLYTFVNWPAVLLWDPYINHPDGAAVAWPPLFDFLVGSTARLLVDSERQFEVVAAWASPVAGAMATLPVYLVGRRVASRGVGLGAAALFALLPISVNYGRIGNADHHASVAMFGAWLLLASVEVVRPDATPRQLALRAAFLGLARAAIVLTWHGSILYLAILEATLLSIAAVSGRRRLFLAEAASCALSLAIVSPVVFVSSTPLGGDYSAIALSRLHLVAVLLVGTVSAWLYALETLRPGRSPWARFVWMGAAGLVLLAVIVALPGPRAGLELGFRFITMQDQVGPRTGEQFPLFQLFGRKPPQPATHTWGYLAYLIPLAPLLLWLAGPRDGRRPSGLVVVAWSSVFGALAISQRRYGNDLSPSGCVAFAFLISMIARWLTARVGLGRVATSALAICVGLAVLSPTVVMRYYKRAESSFLVLSGARVYSGADRRTVAGSLKLFTEAVRGATPETAGFFDDTVRPEYGLVADANVGHALHYGARRATPTDPFWAYIGQENWDLNYALLGARTESEALVLAERLRARYVVTIPDKRIDTIVGQLHYLDGNAREDSPALGHFRLVVEGPKGGKPLREIFDKTRNGPPVVPYKLFEIVEGANLEVAAPVGTPVRAELDIETSIGRSFRYTARADVGADGLARLRVPYASNGGVYFVRTGNVVRGIRVSESDVRDGATLRLELPVPLLPRATAP